MGLSWINRLMVNRINGWSEGGFERPGFFPTTETYLEPVCKLGGGSEPGAGVVQTG